MKGTFACDKKQSGAWDENEIGHERTQGGINHPTTSFVNSVSYMIRSMGPVWNCIHYILEYLENVKGCVGFRLFNWTSIYSYQSFNYGKFLDN